MSRRFVTAIGIILAILLGASFFALIRDSSRSGETVPPYSVRRFDPYGTAAMYRFLVEQGVEVHRLERPRIAEGTSGVLIDINVAPHAGLFGIVTELEESPYRLPPAAVLEWVGKGNRLVHFTRTSSAITDALGIDVRAGKDASAIYEHQLAGRPPNDLGVFTRGRQSIRLFGQDSAPTTITLVDPATFAAGSAEAFIPLDDAKQSGGNRSVVVTVPHGAGEVVLVGAPTPVLNHWVREYDNLDFLLAQCDAGPVVFNEWAHGIGHSGSVIETLVRFGLVPFLLQLMVLVGVYRWSTAGLQEPSPDAAPRRRSTSEQVGLLARMYVGAMSAEEFRRRAALEARQRLAKALRVSPENVRGEVKRHSGRVAESADEMLDRVESIALGKGPTCQSCGYILEGLPATADRCPECGALLSARQRDGVRLAAEMQRNPRDSQDPKRNEAAQLLTDSYRLVEEIERERRT